MKYTLMTNSLYHTNIDIAEAMYYLFTLVKRNNDNG
jgi:hypothetical protein